MEDRCIACGAVMPEGQQVCRSCMEGGSGLKKINAFKEFLVGIKIICLHNKHLNLHLRLIKHINKEYKYLIKCYEIDYQIPTVKEEFERFKEKLRKVEIKN